MNRQRKWDLRYMELAHVVATWSKDPSTKVGAVLVRPNNSVASVGFNGFPPGEDDSPALYLDRSYKYEHVVHAEINAIKFHDQPCPGFTLYTSFPCCPDCVRAACEQGVTRIVIPPLSRGRDQEWTRAWEARMREAAEVAWRYGVELEVIDV